MRCLIVKAMMPDQRSEYDLEVVGAEVHLSRNNTSRQIQSILSSERGSAVKLLRHSGCTGCTG